MRWIIYIKSMKHHNQFTQSDIEWLFKTYHCHLSVSTSKYNTHTHHFRFLQTQSISKEGARLWCWILLWSPLDDVEIWVVRPESRGYEDRIFEILLEMLTSVWNNVKIDNSTSLSLSYSESRAMGNMLYVVLTTYLLHACWMVHIILLKTAQDQTKMWQESSVNKALLFESQSHHFLVFGTLRIMKYHWRNKVSTAALPTSLYSAISLSFLLHHHEHDDHY